MVQIGLRLRQAQSQFFDRQKVQRSVGRAERKVLSRFGAYVRQDARSRIRRRKRPSRSGESPTNQTGLLKRNIFFVYDEARRSAARSRSPCDRTAEQRRSLQQRVHLVCGGPPGV